MARALIVGCGCSGRELGRSLIDAGWSVRGTSRREEALGGIEAAGIEAVSADPLDLGTVTDLIGDVTVMVWLLGSAGGPGADAVNGDRLESLMAHLVDTPVRGFVLEVPERDADRAGGDRGAGGGDLADTGARAARGPVRPRGVWTAAARAAVEGVLSG